MKDKIMEQIQEGLIVSCQAFKDEPLYSSEIMQKMACAALMGGACGIRANTVADITEIKKKVTLPLIGIIKEEYPDSDVYITPTMKEVDALVGCGCEIIAIDATNRTRPGGLTLEQSFNSVREKYPNQLFMADCSTAEEGIFAEKIGFDMIGTTLCGYTDYSKGVGFVEMINKLKQHISAPIIAEGGIWTVEQLLTAYEAGAWSVVIGGAITRPHLITERFVKAIKNTR